MQSPWKGNFLQRSPTADASHLTQRDCQLTITTRAAAPQDNAVTLGATVSHKRKIAQLMVLEMRRDMGYCERKLMTDEKKKLCQRHLMTSRHNTRAWWSETKNLVLIDKLAKLGFQSVPQNTN